MARVRKKSLLEDEEQEKIRRKGKRKLASTVDDDEEDLDEFEIDGFLVDNVEDEEDGGEEDSPMQTQKKRKRRRSARNIVLDDEDLELIRENKSLNQGKTSDGKLKRLKKTGIDTEPMEHSSDDEGSLFDELSDDEYNDEDDMSDFIVDEEPVVYGKGDSLRQKKFKDTKNSSSLSKEAKRRSGKSGLPDQPKNKYGAGEGTSVADADLPERIKIIEDIVGSIPVDRMSIEDESSWILRQLVSNINPLFSEAKSCKLLDSVNREDIVRFLELHHIKKYDIPFIAMYRKEHCPSLLGDGKQDDSENTLLNDDGEGKPKLNWHKILWIIKELDIKWLHLQKRKSMLQKYYNKHFEDECQMSFLAEESSFHKQIFDSITNMLEKAETEREIDDVDMKFNLYFPPADEFLSSGYKRPLMKTYYSDCRKAGLSSLARKIGNPEKFGSLVTLNQVGMVSEEDPEESPEVMASIYTCETFQTSEAVLKGARHMASLMLSCEIPFRKYVRGIFMDKALVSTSPTLKGNIVIDSFHEFAGFKWLKDKPLLKFEDSQWLLIQKAEEEELLKLEIKLPDDAVKELMKVCNDAYLKDSEGTSTQLWNEQRKLILHDTISNFLLPSMEKEARALLNAKAKNCSLMKYGMQFWNRVSVAPYQNNENTAQERGVVACCWGNGKPGTTFVMLDSKGELVDVMHAGSLTLRSQNINDQQRRKSDQKCVLKFLTIHRPKVIVLGAANASCIRLKEDINEIISIMAEDNFQDADQDMNGLPAVVLGDEGLPRLYEESEISTSQFPRQYGIVKRAVALGRYLLNPLAMVATLCGDNKEILSWKLNPLERFLSSDEKMEMIEWIMIDITNQVGIDINLGIRHDWLLAPLLFVSGLGPIKAGILHRELLGGSDVRNRKDLAKFGLNTKRVFCNAVGFLQVSCDDPNFVDTAGNILDRTRIHPESYSLAEELARAVVTKHYADANDTQLNAIECIQNDPKLLENFDLNEYANRLETEKDEYKRVTLIDVKMELLHGFKDPRSPYQEPTQDDEYYMVTGETGVALIEGERVQATVRKVLARQAFCMLESGISGILFREDFSDDIGDIPLTEKLREGVVLKCKVKLIDKSRCQVTLTCKVSELKSVGDQSFREMDPYYSQGNMILPSQQESANNKDIANKSFLSRKISHPHFQNITADQAKEFLADKAVGEYIFHPSTRGLCYLTLSLKFFDAIYVHKDILEGEKSHDMNSLAELGRTLKIGEEIFENIDKVIELYVNPLVVQLKDLINFRKFKKGTKAEVDELLKHEKEEYPNRIPYGIGISYEHPGLFILSYIRSTNPHHEFIAIHPKGFRFRKQIFNNIEQLMAYFQSHINDKVTRANDQSKDYNESGDGRGSGRGRGRGRGGGSCYKCGESGHMSRECTQEGGGGGGRGGGACYKCGESGHMSRECTQEGGGGGGRGGGGGNCYKCGESGHMARECTQEGGGGGGGGGNCYKCGESGHMARECTQEGGGGGGGWGGGGGGSGNCYKCGESGHMARECTQEGGGGGGRGGGGACYKCGESGHMARECTQEGGGGGGRGGGACYKCGESGHMARDCTQESGGGGGWSSSGGRGGGRGRGRGRGSSRSSFSQDDNIDVNDGGGSGWGGTGGGSGWGGTGGKSWGGNSTNEESNTEKTGWGVTTGGKTWGGNSTNDESNTEKGGWGVATASNSGSGNENVGWGAAPGKKETPSGGGSGWGATGGTSWGGNSANEESNTTKVGWGVTSASNGGSGNENAGWSAAPGKNETPSAGGSGWGATGGKSWGANSAKEESNTAKGGWGVATSSNDGSGNENAGWSVAPAKNETPSAGGSGWGATGGKSWGGNSAKEESNTAKGGWGVATSSNDGSGNENAGWSAAPAKNDTPSGGESGWGATGGKSWGGNSTNKESNTTGGWGATTASNGESGNENSGWGATHGKNATPSGGESGWGGTGGGSGWGGTGGGKSWGGSGTYEDSNVAEGGGSGYGGGGGRGGRGGGACYKCGESGHMARECTQEGGGGRGGGGRGGGRGGGACYKCGESGHMARDCTQEVGGGGGWGGGGRGGGRGGGACYKCGESGHMARECTQEGGGGGGGGRGGGGGNCYKCGESGHMARECTQEGGGGGGRGGGGACYKCGESGHMARDCSQGGGGGGRGGGGNCYKCGEAGHMARDCTQESGGGGGWSSGGGRGGGGNCYKCGESGHFARECPSSTG